MDFISVDKGGEYMGDIASLLFIGAALLIICCLGGDEE